MRFTTKHAVLVMVAGIALIVVQGGIWMKSTAHASSQTEIAERESQHRPSEISGIAGMCLLVVAGVLLSAKPKES